jgi:hypothetical protein
MEETATPTVQVGQVYKQKTENPFEIMYARITDIKGEWTKYDLAYNRDEFLGAKSSDRIASFLSRYELEPHTT